MFKIILIFASFEIIINPYKRGIENYYFTNNKNKSFCITICRRGLYFRNWLKPIFIKYSFTDPHNFIKLPP